MKFSIESFKQSQVFRWGIKGGTSILDQVLFSGTNFIVGILLARWLSPADWGGYSVAYASFSIVYQLHTAMITEPMNIIGPAHYSATLKHFVNVQIWIHFLLTTLMAILTAPIAIFIILYGNANIGNNLLILGLTLPFSLLPWLLRRLFYLYNEPNKSLAVSFFYAFTCFIAIWFMANAVQLAGYHGILLLAISGLLSGIPGFALYKEKIYLVKLSEIFQTFLENIKYGSWLIISGILISISNQAQVYIANAILGVEAAGVVRVLAYFQQPMAMALSSIGFLILPTLAFFYGKQDYKSIRDRTRIFTYVILGISAVYELLLIIFGKQLESLLFLGKYADYVQFIAIWGAIPMIQSLYIFYSMCLRAMQYSKAMLIMALFWMPVSILSGILLTSRWSIGGASWSQFIGHLTSLIVLGILYWKKFYPNIQAQRNITP